LQISERATRQERGELHESRTTRICKKISGEELQPAQKKKIRGKKGGNVKKKILWGEIARKRKNRSLSSATWVAQNARKASAKRKDFPKKGDFRVSFSKKGPCKGKKKKRIARGTTGRNPSKEREGRLGETVARSLQRGTSSDVACRRRKSRRRTTLWKRGNQRKKKEKLGGKKTQELI